jgi:hypothetical protein
MDSQYATFVRWALDAVVWIGFGIVLLIPTVLGLSVAFYSLFAIGYAVGYLVLPFLTWGRVFPAPRKPDRNDFESLCVRRCRLWNVVYTINGTRYMLPQFVSTIGWIFLVLALATMAVTIFVVMT